jgi:hypothetical protein
MKLLLFLLLPLACFASPVIEQVLPKSVAQVMVNPAANSGGQFYIRGTIENSDEYLGEFAAKRATHAAFKFTDQDGEVAYLYSDNVKVNDLGSSLKYLLKPIKKSKEFTIYVKFISSERAKVFTAYILRCPLP